MASNLKFIADVESNLSSYIESGSIIFSEESIYLVKSDGSKIKYYKKETDIVNNLPPSNIALSGKLYLLTTDKSINIYDGASWNKYGGTTIENLNNFDTDDLKESDTKKYVTPEQIDIINNLNALVDGGTF